MDMVCSTRHSRESGNQSLNLDPRFREDVGYYGRDAISCYICLNSLQ